jgi:hypothetical protein
VDPSLEKEDPKLRKFGKYVLKEKFSTKVQTF